MKNCILESILNIRFEQALGTNASRRIISTDMDSLILNLAEKKSAEFNESDILTLRQAANVF